MKSFGTIHGTVVLAAALLAVAATPRDLAANGVQDNPKASAYGVTGIVPPDSHRYSELEGQWWHWALALPPDVNPLTDQTGRYGAVGQSGPVWFLAGVWGATGPVVRNCVVPADKSLFFPLVNIVDAGAGWVPTDDIPAIIKDFRETIKAMIDTATDLACEIDGKPVRKLQDFRVQSVVFPITMPVDNLFGVPEFADYTDWLGVDDGYYVLLAPLSPGQHTIHFHARLGAGDPMDVTYNLTVR
jgi:hypothetical protein